MCCMRIDGNTGRKNDAKNLHLHNIAQFCHAESSQLRHVSIIGKKLVKQQCLSTCPHNMANFGPLAAEIGLGVSGTPANFNGSRVLALLLQRRRSPEDSQTLQDVWPSLALVHCIYICFTVKTSHCQNILLSKRPKVIMSPVKTSLHGENVPSQIVPILKPRLHDTTSCCQTSCHTGCTSYNRLFNCTGGWTTGCIL